MPSLVRWHGNEAFVLFFCACTKQLAGIRLHAPYAISHRVDQQEQIEAFLHPEVHPMHISKEQRVPSTFFYAPVRTHFPLIALLFSSSFCFLLRCDIAGFLTHIPFTSSPAHRFPVTWFLWVTRRIPWTLVSLVQSPLRIYRSQSQKTMILFPYVEGPKSVTSTLWNT